MVKFMKSLTKLWLNYIPLSCSQNSCVVTSRMFWKKLEDKEKKNCIFLAINTLSGAIDLFNSEEGKIINECFLKKDFSFLPPVLFEFLLKRGYIFNSRDIEEFVFDTFLNDTKKRNYLTDKILGFFSLDTNCPMGCKYCFEKKNNEKFESSIMDNQSLSAAFEVLNMVRTLQNKKIDFVAGWGGEPLQEKNFEINKIFINYACKYNMPISYFSNLAFIGNKLIDLLNEYKYNIKFIQTTIDGLEFKHNKNRSFPNSFKITISNIDKMLKLGLPVIVRTNVGENNVDDIPQIADFYEQKGWFNYPQFKGYLTHTYDRHHEFTQKFTLDENIAYSKYLDFRDRFPLVRKLQGIKFAPSLRNIIDAFKIRENLDVTKNDFEVEIKPCITYCFSSNRTEYVFTGKPDCSIYCCAECTGISKFRIGSYLESFSLDKTKNHMWGMLFNSMHNVRSIDTLKPCKACKASTYCGGYCGLEAINDKGTLFDVYCKKAYKIIDDFLENESYRLYKRANLLLNNTENITL